MAPTSPHAGRRTIFDDANRRIYDFVRAPDNRRLMRGTGSYSTPFRGTLFGLSKADAVQKALGRGRVDLLWLGSNPCMPRSLDHILNARSGDGDFGDFKHQMRSGFFSSQRWDEQGNAVGDFNPIQAPPRPGWIIYRDCFVAAGVDLERATMANFLPWGSRDVETLLTGVGNADPALLARMIAFADQLNAEIVMTLKPKLLVVPYSLGRNRQINTVHAIGVGMAQARELRRYRFTIGSASAFTCATGVCDRLGSAIRTAYVPHPSALQLSRMARRRLIAKTAPILASCLAA
jgi:hypothetical protein